MDKWYFKEQVCIHSQSHFLLTEPEWIASNSFWRQGFCSSVTLSWTYFRNCRYFSCFSDIHFMCLKKPLHSEVKFGAISWRQNFILNFKQISANRPQVTPLCLQQCSMYTKNSCLRRAMFTATKQFHCENSH